MKVSLQVLPACDEVFESVLAARGYERLPQATAPGALEKLADGSADAALVPAEHALHGEYRDSFQAIDRLSDRLHITEAFLVRHLYSLASQEEAQAVRKIWGTEAGFIDAHSFLAENFPRARRICFESAAQAGNALTLHGPPGIAILGPERELRSFGFRILHSNAVTNSSTLLFLVQRRDVPPKADADTTVLSVSLSEDRPYWLNDFTSRLRKHKRNMTNIFRVPTGSRGYKFFVSLEGHPESPEVEGCLRDMKTTLKETSTRVIGSYKVNPVSSGL